MIHDPSVNEIIQESAQLLEAKNKPPKKEKKKKRVPEPAETQ